MKTILDVIGFLMAVSAYGWMPANPALEEKICSTTALRATGDHGSIE